MNSFFRRILNSGNPSFVVLWPATVFVLVYLCPLGVRPYAAPDEARYAEIPREMLVTGDFIVPRLNGLLYFEKPPLGYWLNAASQSVFGSNNFAIRLPAAIATGATALIVAALLALSQAGLLAVATGALGILTMLLIYGCGTVNILDGPFSLWITAGLASSYVALQARTARPQRIWLVLAGSAFGLAFLTKGFLAFVIPGLTLLPFLVWQRRAKDFWRLGWIPLLVALVVAAPWSVAVALRGIGFWRHFVFEEHLGRFTGGTAQHPEPVWFFIKVLAIGGLPWVVLLPQAIKAHNSSGWSSPLARLALCWLAFPLAFLSLSSGKLLPYLLPCMPALILLIAPTVPVLLGEAGRASFRRSAVVLSSLLVLAGAVAMSAGVFDLPAIPQTSEQPWIPILIGAALLVWAGLLILATRAGQAKHRLGLFASGPVLLFMALPFSVPAQRVGRFPEAAIRSVADQIGPDTLLFSDRAYLQATAWTLKRADVQVVGSLSEFEFGLAQADAVNRAFSYEELDALIRDPGRRVDVVCILHADKHGSHLVHPQPTWQIKQDDILMLGFAAEDRL